VRAVIHVKDVSVFQTYRENVRGAKRTDPQLERTRRGLRNLTCYAKAWLSILEAGGIVHLLRPYHSNFGKRLVKSPKLHFVIRVSRPVSWGSGIGTALIHPCRGALFESMILSELMKKRLNQGFDPVCPFWRDNGGTEIDVVFEDGVVTKAIEMKSGKPFILSMPRGLSPGSAIPGWGGRTAPSSTPEKLPVSWKGMAILPWEKQKHIL
jgi:hypothetical protein